MELFKYRAVNSNSLALLVDGDVFFSSPKDFNDPFDSRFVERDLRSPRERFEREREELRTDDGLLAIAYARVFERQVQQTHGRRKVYCLSETVDSVLMWSHYAESHRGICIILESHEAAGVSWLEFEGRSFNLSRHAVGTVSAEGKLDGGWKEIQAAPPTLHLAAHPVRYQEDSPSVINFHEGSDGRLRGVTFELVKHVDWAYEKERRIVVDEAMLGENPAQLVPEIITGIVFGLKTPKGDVARVMEAASRRKGQQPLKFFRMTPASEGAGLMRMAIPDVSEFVRTME